MAREYPAPRYESGAYDAYDPAPNAILGQRRRFVSASSLPGESAGSVIGERYLGDSYFRGGRQFDRDYRFGDELTERRMGGYRGSGGYTRYDSGSRRYNPTIQREPARFQYQVGFPRLVLRRG